MSDKLYTIIRADVEKIVSRAFWRTAIPAQSLVIITPPSSTNGELADQLMELATELKVNT